MGRLKNTWTLEKDGRRAYLWGTFHYSPVSCAGQLACYLEQADELAVELNPEPVREKGLVAGSGGKTFHESLPPGARGMLKRSLGDDAYAFLRNLSPHVGRAVSQALYARHVLGYRYHPEQEARQLAEALGKPVRGLETLEEQMALASGSEPADNEEYWRVFEVRMESDIRTLYELYEAENLEALGRRARREAPVLASPGREERLYRKAKERMGVCSPFIVLGAAHVPPFLERARKDNYLVRK